MTRPTRTLGALLALTTAACSHAAAPRPTALASASAPAPAPSASASLAPSASPSAGPASPSASPEARAVASFSAPAQDREPAVAVLPLRAVPRAAAVEPPSPPPVLGIIAPPAPPSGHRSGDSPGESFGYSGLGATGWGPGGGGTGEGTLGLGSLGIMGHGAGRPSPRGGAPAGPIAIAPGGPSRAAPSVGTAVHPPARPAASPGAPVALSGPRFWSPRFGMISTPAPRSVAPAPIVRAAVPTVAGAISPDVIRRVVLRNMPRVTACAERARAREPEFSGRLVVRFAVAPNGSVPTAGVQAHNLSQPAVGDCVASALRTMRFPEVPGAVVINYPFVFMNRDGSQPPPIPPGAAPSPQRAQPLVLTAASVGDADRRENYREYLTRHPVEREELALDMTRRVRVRVLDEQGRPVNGAAITLTRDAWSITARTHADGTWDYFPSVDGPHDAQAAPARLDVTYAGQTFARPLEVPAQSDGGTVEVRLARPSTAPTVIDLAFVIDVTGSMEDELRYVNAEVASVVRRVRDANPAAQVRVSATFYGDRGDEFLVRQIPFSRDVERFGAVMQQVHAAGGGDYPEDMNAGLEAALTGLSFSGPESVKVLVLIADAPPQPYADENFTWRAAMHVARQYGVRVLPVAASGADRTVEYLFRAMGTYTSTPYVYLTDDSGIGNAHMEADTDRVAVERFNDLLVRVLSSDLRGEGMHEPGPLGAQGG